MIIPPLPLGSSRPVGRPHVEVRIYHLGQIKARQTCRPEDAARVAALWRDVMGMHCEIVPGSALSTRDPAGRTSRQSLTR